MLLLGPAVFVTAFCLLSTVVNVVPVVGPVLQWVCSVVVVLKVCFWLADILCRYLDTRKIREVDKKAVLVTGCDTGFGHELALKLHAMGFKVYAGCLFINGEGACFLKDVCSPNLQVLELDVTKDEHFARALTEVDSTLDGHLFWGVVANAGIAIFGESEWHPIEDFKKTFDVNLFGVVRTVHTFVPLLRRDFPGSGRIVVTSSIWSRVSVPVASMYCSSKYAVRSYAEALRREMNKFGVKVCMIEPNMYATKLTDKTNVLESIENIWNKAPLHVRETYGEDYFGRVYLRMKLALLDKRYKTYEVVDDVVHALTARVPRPVYRVDGIFRKYAYYVLEALPSVIQDKVICFLTQPYFGSLH